MSWCLLNVDVGDIYTALRHKTMLGHNKQYRQDSAMQLIARQAIHPGCERGSDPKTRPGRTSRGYGQEIATLGARYSSSRLANDGWICTSMPVVVS